MKMYIFVFALLLSLGLSAALKSQENVGKRPYEMDWAGRVENEDPPLIDFEDFGNWKIDATDTEVSFVQSREQQIWGKYVGKLTYRATGNDPKFSFGPEKPVKIDKSFDAISCWIYGNNWGYAPSPLRPEASISVTFEDSSGKQLDIYLVTVNWEEWFLAHRRLTPQQQQFVKNGASFVRFNVSNCGNEQPMMLHFDNFSVFTEQFKPLTFAPRKLRGTPMFPGQTKGTNTGPGKLPFPNSPRTILPDNLTKNFKNSVRQVGKNFVFEYKGDDGQLVYTLTPKTGTFSDITAQFYGRGKVLIPLAGGGAVLSGWQKSQQSASIIGKPVLKGSSVVLTSRLKNAERTADVTYTFRIWNKSLVIDTASPGGNVEEVRYGSAKQVPSPRLVQNPYYHYGASRPSVLIMGDQDKPLFLTGNTDWYLSNSSVPYALADISGTDATYQGGVRYGLRTDGKRNDCYERFFVTLSPRYEEMLPNIPNPKSPWMKVTGTGVWRAHGAGNRQNDMDYWKNVWRWGMREIIVTDHETGWRDGGESFTFRTRPAPGKGGDKGQYDYARFMQDTLGFVYGPYNNFTDFAPVNEYWSYDIASRDSDNQLGGAWMRCYAPKPARAVEYAEKLPPIIEKKFGFSTAYCDVHTAVAPWERVDYDYRVPGAATFAATFYSYGEIMLLQKAAWDGPVYSEGNFHFYYTGLTDGNYAQDRTYNIPDKPWLVDLDLLKMHPLGCNFGMGAPSMFYTAQEPTPETKEDIEAYYDRFYAATIAFGHPGFFTMESGFANALCSYYMLQQLHANYTQVPVSSIKYLNDQGTLVSSSAAVATGAYKRSQIVTTYSNGTVTVVNGNRKLRMQALGLDLPPNGYAGWTKDKSIYVLSADKDGKHKRSDYAVTPAYIYVDGRGKFERFEKAGSNGNAICRIIDKNHFEILSYNNAECGFAISVQSAVALDKDNNKIGPAETRHSRGLSYVMPVEGAFSYLVTGNSSAPESRLSCDRDVVVPGETVLVKGNEEHSVTIAKDSTPGQRVWFSLEGEWIDFTVASLVDVSAQLSGDSLKLQLVSHGATAEEFTIKAPGHEQSIKLDPEIAQTVILDMGTPLQAEDIIYRVEVANSAVMVSKDYVLHVESGPQELAKIPENYVSSIQMRGESPQSPIPPDTGAFAERRDCSSGRDTKKGIFVHPPYLSGAGDTFITFSNIELPADKAKFVAMVGKVDGSYLGDGILYRVIVEDTSGKETEVAQQSVTEHKWRPIEADLSAWAGQRIQLRLVLDIGPKDDSSGDWGCWADMRIVSQEPVLTRRLDGVLDPSAREPSPDPATGLSLEDIRTAKSGRMFYETIGLEQSPQYTTVGYINSVEAGALPSGGGNEITGEWGSAVLELPLDVIKSLQRRNVLKLNNLGKDYFKIRRFRIELDMPDGRKVSSAITASAYTQPESWLYAEGVGVAMDKQITVDLWFDL